jgi:hypothetical protein
MSFLWMWQKLHCRNRQKSSCAASWTEAQSQRWSFTKSKLAQHAYEEGHKVGWILEIESNTIWRNYKESAHTACFTNPISQPSYTLLSSGSPYQQWGYQLTEISMTWQILHGFLYGFSPECSVTTPHMALAVGIKNFTKLKIRELGPPGWEVWGSKMSSWDPRDSDLRMTALARASSIFKRQTHSRVREDNT